MHTHVRARTHTHTQTRVRACAHTHTRIRRHAHAHTHTHARSRTHHVEPEELAVVGAEGVDGIDEHGLPPLDQLEQLVMDAHILIDGHSRTWG